jgi:hypothetical protein
LWLISLVASAGDIRIGSHRSLSSLGAPGSSARRGITPTMVQSVPSISIERPIAAGSLPKRRRQSPSPRIATAGERSKSSAAAKGRPRAGVIPSVGIIDAVIRAPRTRSGSAVPPVTVKDPKVTIAMLERLRSSCQAL